MTILGGKKLAGGYNYDYTYHAHWPGCRIRSEADLLNRPAAGLQDLPTDRGADISLHV